MSRRKLGWWISGGVVAVLVAGVGAPYVNVNRYQRRIRQGLQTALGRQVEIQGEMRLNLFRGPGFTLDRVVVHEDPSVGLEPLAYMDSLQARVSLRSLWTGHLEFSSLRLNDPSINLTKRAGGNWNFEPLVTKTVGAATKSAAPPAGFPKIEVRGGRVNFKFGETKSVLYLTDPEIDITAPERPGGEWDFRFEGEPARTDRPARGLGQIAGHGRWKPDPAGGRLACTLQLEKSRIDELMTLLHGHDIGVHGTLSAQVRASGPVSGLKLEGRANIQDIHRWDLVPTHDSGWLMDLRGSLNLLDQAVEFQAVPSGGAAPDVTVRFRARDYLSAPRWGTLITLHDLPVDALPEVARRMGIPLPPQAGATGHFSGAIGLSSSSAMQGRIFAADLALTLPHTPALDFETAEITLDGHNVRAWPAVLRGTPEEKLELDARYSAQDQQSSIVLSAAGASFSTLQRWGQLLTDKPVPLLENCSAGTWKGKLQLVRAHQAEPQWSGDLQLDSVSFPLPGLAAPLELHSAHLALADTDITLDRMAGMAGKISFQGEYRYRAKAAWPDQFRIVVAQAEGSELERIFQPVLRRRESFFARALRLGRTRVPDWLAGRRASGMVSFGSLLLGDSHLSNVRGRLHWENTTAEFTDFKAGLGDANLAGRLSVNLARQLPSYRFNGTFQSLSWREAKWEGQTVVQTSGLGSDLLRNLRAEGSFACRAVELMPDSEWRGVTGSYRFDSAGGRPRLIVKDLKASIGAENYLGQAASRDDGRFYVEMGDGAKQIRLLGTLLPFQLEPAR